MRNLGLSLGATLIVMFLFQPVSKQINDKPVEVKKYNLIQPLEGKVYAEKQTITTQVAKPAVAAPVAASGACGDWLAQAGITDPDAVWLISKESGCNPGAINPSSGACGIPQALPCSKLPCTLQDPVCQLKWMSSYVANRYGSWAAARSFHLSHNWY